jgi:dTDP-4-amino-4,6-dideoxygalactose transaminase
MTEFQPLFSPENSKRVGVPNVVDIEAVLDGVRIALTENQLTNNGPRIQEFEAKIAEYLGTAEFVTVNNATNGLMAVAKALDLGVDLRRRKIIVPSFTFCATVNAMVWMQLEPVFCDIDPANYQLDPAAVRQLITPEVCAILGVHVYGIAGDLHALEAIAAEAQIPLFFDAAHAFGCSYGGKKIGHWGRCEIFSFHATKAFNTFEGGGIATNDRALAQRLRKLNNFGFVGYDNIGDIGINSKMSEINAIQGLVMLRHYPDIIAHNKRNYLAYKKALAGAKELKLLEHTDYSNYHYMVVETATAELRDRLVEQMAKHNVILRKYFYPGVHRMQPYQLAYPESDLPVTDRVSNCVLCLPSGLHVSAQDAALIGEHLAENIIFGK